jgi:hypothetical protein
VSQNGKNLAKPGELIHPFSPAAKLFSEQDHRFPVGNDLRNVNRLYVLETLGMVKDLDWAGIHERAQSVAKTNALERSRKLIEYINRRIDQLPKPDGYIIQRIKFLPVLRHPVDQYLLPWKGLSGSALPRFCAPNEIFLPEDAKLVGSSSLIVNTSDESGCGELNAKVKDLLGFSSRLPAEEFVIQQLDEAITFWRKLSEQEKQDMWKRFAIE